MQKILVANRGEIALRVMHTARKMGIATVAVYSEADRDAPHVRYADQAVCLGEAPSSQSYLRGDRIVEAALSLDADAIHPGYGFLSENAAFARRVSEAGLVFIGPTPEAIQTMGDKLAAKEAVKGYRIPMVPGTDHPVSEPGEVLDFGRDAVFAVQRRPGGSQAITLLPSPAAPTSAVRRPPRPGRRSAGSARPALDFPGHPARPGCLRRREEARNNSVVTNRPIG